MYDDDRMTALKQVYDHLQDDESRKIYMARSLYSLSDDKTYMKEIVREMSISKELEKWAKGKERLILFGGGTWGKAITSYFDNIRWECIIDNNKSGQKLNGYDICSLDEIENVN